MGSSGGITNAFDSLTVAGNSISGAQISSAPADLGYLAWTFPPKVANNSFVMPTAGRLELARIRRVPAGTVTNIVIHLIVAGGTLTAGQCFAALYTTAGARVGVTTDRAASWASTGRKVMALAAPYAHTGGDLYAGWWFNGTTGPALARASGLDNVFLNSALASPNMDHCTADTGLTTTAPDPFGTQTGSSIAFWVALS